MDYDWVKRDVLGDILLAFRRDADLEWLSIDSTIVRAYSQAAGARKGKRDPMPRVWVAREAA